MSEDEAAYLIYVGVSVSVLGNIMISVALNIQKYTHNRNDRASSDMKVPYVKRPLWWLGLFLMIGGECGNFLAYAFAPSSLVAPLGTVALVSNAIIAPFVLKERFRTQDLLGIVFAIGGAIVIVLFADSTAPVFTVAQLKEAFRETKFIIYLCVTFTALILLIVLSPRFGKKFLILDMTIVGLFAGYTVISTKAISTILTQEAWRMFLEWIFYVMLLVLIVTGVLQIRYLQSALQQYDSTEVIPSQFVMFTLSAIIGGGVLYDDFSRMTALEIGLFMVGVILTFIGVFLISNGRRREIPELEEPDSEEQLALVPAEGEIIQAPPPLFPSLEDQSFAEKLRRTANSAIAAILYGLENRRIALVTGMEQIRKNYQNPDETVPLRRRSQRSVRSDRAVRGQSQSTEDGIIPIGIEEREQLAPKVRFYGDDDDGFQKQTTPPRKSSDASSISKKSLSSEVNIVVPTEETQDAPAEDGYQNLN